jgi:hypothetical protein
MTTELAPIFEAPLMLHDDIMEAVCAINSNQLLPADVAKTILVDTQQYPYVLLGAQSGKQYEQLIMDGALKRFYIFADPEDPKNTNSMFALQCNVSKAGSVINVMPEQILRGPEADFVLSIKYGCCAKNGRTMIYSDTKTDGTSFLRVAFSGQDIRPEIQQIWRNLKLVNLNPQGLATLAHMAEHLTGHCDSHTHAHKPNYNEGKNLSGQKLTIS